MRPELDKVIKELLNQSIIKDITNPEIKKGVETLRSILGDSSQDQALCDKIFFEKWDRDFFD